MHMKDWNAYRSQLSAGATELARFSPDTIRGYVVMSGAGQKTTHFNNKMRELIAVAVAIVASILGRKRRSS